MQAYCARHFPAYHAFQLLAYRALARNLAARPGFDVNSEVLGDGAQMEVAVPKTDGGFGEYLG